MGRRTTKTADFPDIDIPGRAFLPRALAELVNDLTERVIPLQNESGREWAEVRIDLWLDSGRIIAYPAQTPLTERIDVGGCVKL